MSVRASWDVDEMPRWDGSNERFLCSIVWSVARFASDLQRRTGGLKTGDMKLRTVETVRRAAQRINIWNLGVESVMLAKKTE